MKYRSVNIYLVGPMGAGKSTIGRMLSQALSRPFFDSDRVIEERSGANIPWIFDVEGEQGFRDREEAVIDELTQDSQIVMATGGGAILRVGNRQNLQGRGEVFFLDTSLEQQVLRTSKDKNRPLLQQGNPREKLKALLEERRPLYMEAADHIIETDQRHPKYVVQEILKLLEK